MKQLTDYWDRTDGSRTRERRPLSVVVGAACLIAGSWWIEELESTTQNPTLTVEFDDPAWIALGIALVVGMWFGVRRLWIAAVFFLAVGCVLMLSSAFDLPSAQTIGGLLLYVAALVCLALPSTARFERRRVRLVLEDR